MSPRRAGMLARNVVAVHAVRSATSGATGTAQVADSAWIAVLHSMPFAACGRRLDEAKLLAAHKEAWRLAAVRPDDPLACILTERDPLRRLRLALAAETLGREELATVVADCLTALPDGTRHAAALHLFETEAGARLNAVVLDEAAAVYREVACGQEVLESVRPGSARHQTWKRIEALLARLDPRSIEAQRTANLLTGLFAAGRLDDEEAVERVEAAWRAAQDAFAAGAA
jgi:hypothetical protein